MSLHPAENRGYRELYVSGRQLVRRWDRLETSFAGSPTAETLSKASTAVRQMLDELTPLTERHGLYSNVAAQGGGGSIGAIRGAVFDRFLERNQALRVALCDLEHVTTLLGYLAAVSETRGDPELPEFCRSWERRLRRQLGAVRRAAIELGTDPGEAIKPLDPSALGRAAHRTGWAMGTFGEWFDRQAARRKS